MLLNQSIKIRKQATANLPTVALHLVQGVERTVSEQLKSNTGTLSTEFPTNVLKSVERCSIVITKEKSRPRGRLWSQREIQLTGNLFEQFLVDIKI